MSGNWRAGRRDLPAKDPGGPPAKFLPQHLYALFRPRPPIEFKNPVKKRKALPIEGIAKFTEFFETEDPPERILQQTPHEKKQKLTDVRDKAHAAEIEQRIAEWEPAKQENQTGDAYNTLFVARISHDVTEKKLKREYERFGPIKAIRMVEDKDGNPRGYAFIEYEDDRDMRKAYKRGDGLKVAGRRVLVDVERGRTVRNWRPRRLGGGLGSTRKGGRDVNRTTSGREGGGGRSSSSSSSSSSISSSSSSSRSSSSYSSSSSSNRDRDRRSSGGSSRSDDRDRDRRSSGSSRSDRDRDRRSSRSDDGDRRSRRD